MKCRIVTQNRTGILRLPPHPCEWHAVRDGLCGIHLKQRDSIPRQIARLERKLAELRSLQEVMDGPAAPENPS